MDRKLWSQQVKLQ